jgi:hypothetical protein
MSDRVVRDVPADLLQRFMAYAEYAAEGIGARPIRRDVTRDQMTLSALLAGVPVATDDDDPPGAEIAAHRIAQQAKVAGMRARLEHNCSRDGHCSGGHVEGDCCRCGAKLATDEPAETQEETLPFYERCPECDAFIEGFMKYRRNESEKFLPCGHVVPDPSGAAQEGSQG